MGLADVFTRHHVASARGVETHVAEAGQEASGLPPIVLLHGNPDSHAAWSFVVERLAPAHRCIAPDLPGFGQSRAPDDFDCGLTNQAAWVHALLEALDLPRVHLAVHDIGGAYGLAFASLHPARVASLTILNTTFFPDYRWHFWARVWRTRGLGEVAMAVVNRAMFVRELRRGSPSLPPAYAAHAFEMFDRRATKRMVVRWYRAMDPAALVGWDARLRAAIATMPRQVLWGDLDPWLPSATADRFGVPARHFADAGHWPMLERPADTAAAIAALVARA